MYNLHLHEKNQKQENDKISKEIEQNLLMEKRQSKLILIIFNQIALKNFLKITKNE